VLLAIVQESNGLPMVVGHHRVSVWWDIGPKRIFLMPEVAR
jgi:hypothetical protein